MYTDILRAMVGIEVFPVISLLLFAGVFMTVLVWAVRADRRVLDRHAALPLDAPTAGDCKTSVIGRVESTR